MGRPGADGARLVIPSASQRIQGPCRIPCVAPHPVDRQQGMRVGQLISPNKAKVVKMMKNMTTVSGRPVKGHFHQTAATVSCGSVDGAFHAEQEDDLTRLGMI